MRQISFKLKLSLLRGESVALAVVGDGYSDHDAPMARARMSEIMAGGINHHQPFMYIMVAE